MTEEQKKPGVRLEHRGSKLTERAGQKIVEMVVVAKVEDEELWRQVEQKFINGFDVYTDVDVRSQMISSLSHQNDQFEQKIAQLEYQKSRANEEIEDLKRRLDAAQQPLIKLRNQLLRKK